MVVTSRAELIAAAAKRKQVAFVDAELLPQIGGVSNVSIIAVTDDSLASAVGLLNAHPRLSHVITTSMLAMPQAAAELESLLERLELGPEQHGLAAASIGRVALLASSSRREARFERMREFLATQGISPRTISSTSDVAEELVTNALYDAPAEAGYFKAPVSRTEDVDLPPEHACEVSYGIEDGNVFVRTRDPFGALTRARLLGVLNRCRTSGVLLDESRGGAGLGLWRVFSSASTVIVTVLPGRLTDILVRIQTKKRRPSATHLHAIHMFIPEDHALDGAQGRFAAEHDCDLMDESFTAVYVA